MKMASTSKIALRYLRARAKSYGFALRVVGVPKPSIEGVGGSHLSINEINFIKVAGAFDNYNSSVLSYGGFFPAGEATVRKVGEYDYLVTGVYRTPVGSRISEALRGDFLGGWVQAFSELNQPEDVIVTHLREQ
jgi:hypothetical protein